MCCIMGDISLAVFFSIVAGMSDGPGALLEFRATSCFMMPLRFLGFELREIVMGLLLG